MNQIIKYLNLLNFSLDIVELFHGARVLHQRREAVDGVRRDGDHPARLEDVGSPLGRRYGSKSKEYTRRCLTQDHQKDAHTMQTVPKS